MLRQILLLTLLVVSSWSLAHAESYPIVDTGQNACFNNSRQIGCPEPGDKFNGQDAQYKGKKARYIDNNDGTVTDLVTGLMWVKARGQKMEWQEAVDGAKGCRVGGHDDWRAPTIKELYSLIDFNGWVQREASDSIPFLNTRYFDFAYGNTKAGERSIDCQDWSATRYVGTTMGNSATAFGVNFADGRIKGYPVKNPRKGHGKYIRYVRGNPSYGKNNLVDLKNGTVEDKATGLIWMQEDSGKPTNWQGALGFCENLIFAGRNDWRLPSAKELQSIVDYTRSPTTTNSAAIDPVFSVTHKESYFWSSTTHLNGPKPDSGVYVAFGRAMGYFSHPGSNNTKRFIDVHGAGAQRSDPKSGNPKNFKGGFGPQGDDIRIYNYVRCVAGGGVDYYEPPYKRIPEWKGRGNPNMFGSGQRMGMQNRQGMGMPNQQRMSQDMSGQSGEGGRMQGPPREAYEACSSGSSGSKCSFETPHGTISGLCYDIAGDLVCVPENAPKGGPPRQ